MPSGCEAGGSCNACSRGRRHGPPWDESSVRGPVRTRRALPLPPVAFHIPHISSPVFPRLRRRGWRSWRGPRTWAGVDRRPPPVRRGRSRRAAAAGTSTGAQPGSHMGPSGPSADPGPYPAAHPAPWTGSQMSRACSRSCSCSKTRSHPTQPRSASCRTYPSFLPSGPRGNRADVCRRG